MTTKVLDRIMDGARTPEGKVIAVLLALCLSLMSWNVAALSYAMGNDGAVAGEQEAAEQQEALTEEAPEPEPVAQADEAVEAVEPAADEAVEAASTDEAVEPEATDAADAEANSTDAADPDVDAAKDEVAYPAKDFTGNAGGVYVSVEAPEGAFPEGTTMRVAYVAPAVVMDVVEEAVEGNVTNVAAVDITFHDASGAEIEPAKEIKVSLRSSAIAQADADEAKSIEVVHIDDADNATVVDQQNDGTAANEVAFESGEFSIYVIVTTDEEGQEQEVTQLTTYEFQDSNGDPFKFYNTAGNLVSTQIVKDGESLQDVGLPSIPNGDTFRGWYAYDVDAGKWGEQVKFDAPLTVSETSTVVVRPFFGKVAYVTFYENAAGTNILNKVQVALTDGSATYDIATQTVTAPTSELAFVGWSTEAGVNDDNRTAISDTIITVTGDVSYYPIFKSGHWVSFFSGAAGSGASYTAPAFVVAGKDASTVKPADPTWKGYEFEYWTTEKNKIYTEDNTYILTNTPPAEFDFDQELTEDTTLYAYWGVAETTYTVVFWQQNVTDSKNAADSAKTYSFASQETVKGTTGETVSVSGYANKYTGFTLNTFRSNTATEVKADGTSVINLYYDRQTITMRFYKNTSSEAGPGYDGKFWTSGTSSYVTTFTGLYGQTLAQNNYSWPTDYKYSYYYNNGSNHKGMSYLGQFVLPDELSEQVEIRFYRHGSKNATAEFYLQNTDGSYPSTASATGSLSGGAFIMSEKYDGYNVAEYRRYTGNHNWVDGSWVTGGSGTQIDGMTYYYYAGKYYYNIAIRYALKSHTLKYLDSVDSTELAGISSQTVKYSESLADYKPSSDFTPVSQYAGRVWDGKWYKDQACTTEFDWNDTMPNADMVVYAGWKNDKYRVVIDPNGGQLSSGEATYFNNEYGQTVLRYEDVVRDYVEDPSGNYYYHFDLYNNEKGGSDTGNRAAGYGEDPSASTDDVAYSYSKGAYALIGWYAYDLSYDDAGYAQPSGSGEMHNFGEGVTKPLYLQAKWRRVGEYHVSYQAQVRDASGNEISGLEATDIPNDPNSYADNSESAVLAAPATTLDLNGTTYVFQGWLYDGEVYRPGDTYEINASLAQDLVVGHDDGNDIVQKTIFIYPVYAATDNLPVEVTSLTLDANGEGATVDGKKTVTYGDIQVNSAQVLPTAEREGYDFLGWSTSNVATAADFKVGDEVGVDNKSLAEGEENMLYAVWQIKTFDVTVTKEVDGPSKDTAVFAFSYTKDGVAQSNFSLTGNEDGVEVETESGTVEVPHSVTHEAIPYGAVININESADGYETTVSAQAEGEGVDFANGEDYTITANTEITYTNTQEKLTVFFDTRGHGTAPDNQSVYYGESAAQPDTDPAAAGYEFLGWYTGLEVGGVVGYIAPYDFGSPVTKDTTLYAKWASVVSVEIAGADESTTYDGTDQSAAYTLKYKIAGEDASKEDVESHGITANVDFVLGEDVDSNEATLSAEEGTLTAKNAGEYASKVTVSLAYGEGPDELYVIDEGVYDEDSANATWSVDVNLTIARRAITVTANGGSKQYDGSAITAEEKGYAISGALASGQSETVALSGERTLVGTTPAVVGDVTIKAGEADVTRNYEITKADGTLTVAQSTIDPDVPFDPDDPAGAKRFTVSAPEDVVYSGAEQHQVPIVTDAARAEGTQELVLDTDYIVSYSDEATNVGTVTVTATGIGNYSGTVTRTYEIIPRPVTLTSDTATKAYDGTALTAPAVTATAFDAEAGVGFVPGEGVNADVTGTQTLVGSSENAFGYSAAQGTDLANYIVATVFGTLTVTDGTEGTDEPEDSNVAGKTHDGSATYGLGDVVSFDIEVTNIYERPMDVVVAELEGFELAQSEFAAVPAGQTVSTTATHVVTEADIAAGGIANTATVTFPGTGASFTATDEVVELEGAELNYAVSKTIVNERESYSVGDAIEYEIAVRNTGNQSQAGIQVADQLSSASGAIEFTSLPEGAAAAGNVVTLGVLAPGETAVIGASYTVQREDAGASIANAATATNPSEPGAPERGDSVEANPVESLYALTFNYVYADGSQAAPSTTATYLAGEEWTEAFPAIDGYASAVNGVAASSLTGTMRAADDAYTVVYTAIPAAVAAAIPPAAAGPVAPVAAAVPAAAAAVAPPAAAVTIDDDGNPLVESIDDDENALASGLEGEGEGSGVWSLFDLICTIVTVVLGLTMIVGMFGRKRKDGENDDPNGTYVAAGEQQEPDQIVKRRRILRGVGAVLAVFSVVLFVLTQDLTQPMAIFDMWSILFAIAGIANIVLTVVSRKKSEDDDDDEEQQRTGYVPMTA